MNDFDWKLASIIGMLIALGINVVIVSSPLTVFIGLIPLFNYLLHLWGCKIVNDKWDNKAYIRKLHFTERPFYVLYYTLDGQGKARYFFGEGAEEGANEFLNKLKEPSFTVY